MDDPVSIVLYLVTALAGGMYPLGFIFGGCSACCQGCQPCSNCASPYQSIDADGFPCQDTLDLIIAESQIDTKTKANVTPSSEATVNLTFNILAGLSCESLSVPGLFITGTIQIRLLYLEAEPIGDSCGCLTCGYQQGLQIELVGQSPPTTGRCRVFPTFGYDKCSQQSVAVTVTLTKQQIKTCLERVAWLCAGLPDTLDITLTYELDYECECGACCRGETCSENESKLYCELRQRPHFPAGGGTWHGVGTDCDPNPCT
jgi:hypothetical protein